LVLVTGLLSLGLVNGQTSNLALQPQTPEH
jgi:hypothetical protein